MANDESTSTAPKGPEVVVNRRTRGMANDPTAPVGAEGGTVVMRHPETQGVTIVPRSAYQSGWRFRGWQEVNLDEERDALYQEAVEMGVPVLEDADGRTIVESMRAFKRSQRGEVR